MEDRIQGENVLYNLREKITLNLEFRTQQNCESNFQAWSDSKYLLFIHSFPQIH